MANCFFKKLKGSVQNDSLVKLGELVIDVVPNISYNEYSSFIYLCVEDNTTVTLSDGAYCGTSFETIESEHLTSISFTAGQGRQLFFANVAGKIHIPSKYKISQYEDYNGNSIFRINLDNLKYCDELAALQTVSYNTEGSIDSILDKNIPSFVSLSNKVSGSSLAFNQSLTRLTLSSPNIHANTLDISGLSNLTILQLNDCTNIVGDVSNLAQVGLTRCEIDNTGITGSVEAFITAMVQKGITSKATENFVCSGFLNMLDFGGEKHPQDVFGFLQWNTANKIFIFAGSDDFTTTTKVYAKGASASEIAAWQNAGKEVVVIQ
jgi:hypothetical protein